MCRWFDSCLRHFCGCVAQSVEHLTFNQVVEGSIPSALRLENPCRRCRDFLCICGFREIHRNTVGQQLKKMNDLTIEKDML